MGVEYWTGTAGRVRTGANVVVASASMWRLQRTTASVPFPTFESPADPVTGVVFPTKARGLGDAKCSIEGIYNTDAVESTETGTVGWTNGAVVSLDLFVLKPVGLTPGKGFENVAGFFSSFQVGQNINNQACGFSGEVEVSGVPPAFTAFS